MFCQLCSREAVSRCYSCGDLVCEDHQVRDNCFRCETAIAPGDRRYDRISTIRLAKNAKPGWWRPIPAEDYDPPACAVCHGLARSTCRNCGDRYCPDHAGKHALCIPCEKSSLLGLYILIGIGGLIGVMWLIGLMQSLFM